MARPACMDSGCQTWSTIAVVTLPVSNGNSLGTMQRILKAADLAKREQAVFVTPSIGIGIYPDDGTAQQRSVPRDQICVHFAASRSERREGQSARAVLGPSLQ
ncbi:hypothetical protein [Cupriavidus necator]|uniref:hypothetical protein n=1 Tax=Cupriavidus necator TaxID=106590 RepID=UPI00115FB1A0|nr:hypothetical protein [Cupriavidus necator]